MPSPIYFTITRVLVAIRTPKLLFGLEIDVGPTFGIEAEFPSNEDFCP